MKRLLSRHSSAYVKLGFYGLLKFLAIFHTIERINVVKTWRKPKDTLERGLMNIEKFFLCIIKSHYVRR